MQVAKFAFRSKKNHLIQILYFRFVRHNQSLVTGQKGQGSLGLDPKGIVYLLSACHLLPYQHGDTVSSLPSWAGAIAHIIWILQSLTFICVFLVPLHPKSQDCLLWDLYLLIEHKTWLLTFYLEATDLKHNITFFFFLPEQSDSKKNTLFRSRSVRMYWDMDQSHHLRWNKEGIRHWLNTGLWDSPYQKQLRQTAGILRETGWIRAAYPSLPWAFCRISPPWSDTQAPGADQRGDSPSPRGLLLHTFKALLPLPLWQPSI